MKYGIKLANTKCEATAEVLNLYNSCPIAMPQFHVTNTQSNDYKGRNEMLLFTILCDASRKKLIGWLTLVNYKLRFHNIYFPDDTCP